MPLIGYVSVIILLAEIGVPLSYFGAMSLVGLLGPVFKEPILLVAWVGFVIVAMLCFLSFTGTVLCVLGIVSRKSFFKWLLIFLSVLGVIPLAVAIYTRVDDADHLAVLYALAGWSVLLFITTLIAYSYINGISPKQHTLGG